MASYTKSQAPGLFEPRDPGEINEQVREARGFLSLIAVAVVVAIAFALYFLYAGAAPTQPTVAVPRIDASPAPAKESATRPSTQTPTP